jgi:uncharacterized protein (DUF697 family)
MSYFANPLTDYSPQLETGGSAPLETGVGPSTATVFSDDEELELASEFLEVASERDLDHFIDELTGRASRAMNEDLDQPVERDLGSIFKSIAKVVLPLAGGAVGFFAGGPPGAALGSGLASTVGHALGLELEGLSPEDSEFEVAKQFVRFAGAAAKNAHDAGPTGDPAKQAREAANEAARLHAPGLMDLHGELSVERQRKRPDRPGQTAPSQREKGETTMESFERGQPGLSRGHAASTNGQEGRGLSEDEQMDLASQLMQLETEEEFENFLGDIISKGLKAVGGFIDSPTGQAVGSALKDAAKTLLPVAGQAIGGYFGGAPGGQIGGALGSAASNLFEAEAEAEEQEWEAANVFVRVAVDTINNAADAPRDADPHHVAHHAVAEAMRRQAPHAASAWFSRHHEAAARNGIRRHHTGHWVRHGQTIVVHGI